MTIVEEVNCVNIKDISKFVKNVGVVHFVNIKYVVKIKHFINYSFASLGVLGLFFLNRKIFNKEIAILSCILTFLNPFFFGHMGMNTKDIIIFFALIWFCYYFYKYIKY